MITTMTKDEREAFLAKPWVAVISIPEEGRGPLTVPVWYLYEPGGELRIWTGHNSRKARLLASAKRMSVCVQDPKPPYKYVSIEGTVSIEPVQFERDVCPLAFRYFGGEAGERYLESLGGTAGVAKDILIRLKPERWLSVDYAKLGPPQK
jgi:nitroimidazol reductase NimA-like FMN-containing flavoprotein (pyridoxamine 5'-phosphate oxidase superfamily)